MSKLEANSKMDAAESESQLFEESDKGIDSIQNGRTVPCDKAMRMIREKLEK